MRNQTPGKETGTSLDRRRALALLGGGAAAVSVLGLAGCGGDDSAPRPELIKPEPDGEPTEPPTQAEAESMQASSSDAMADSSQGSDMDSAGDQAKDAASDTIASDGGMPKVDESSAKAKQLAYVHDASTVSPDAQPRYADGQQCANCALYQGGSAEWGACPLFNGQQVKRTGWCNAYAPRGA
jgi:hypothetical protein